MKICVYADVHGNFEALSNLYNTEDYKTADIKIFLGDAVTMCPDSNECCEKIKQSGDVSLMGNNDYVVANKIQVDIISKDLKEKIEHRNWIREQLTPENLKWLKSLSFNKTIKSNNKTLYFTHYSWDCETRITNDLELNEYNADNLDRMFYNIETDIIIFGHEHFPTIVKSEKKTYVCVGSLGMKHPGNYVMIEIDEKNFKIIPKKIDFNLSKLKQRMTKYPYAEEYAKWL